MAISEPFARILAAGRSQFNARVAEARRRHPTFDSDSFAGFLQTGVDPLVRALAEAAPDQLPANVLLAYDLALDMVTQGLAGPKAHSNGVNRVWQEVIPAYSGLAAQNPLEVIGSLTNAIVNIGKVPGARPEQWLSEMAGLASQVESLAHLRLVGQVLAWRSGLAHFRPGALRAADQLPEALALAALGCPHTIPWQQVRATLAANPWWIPATALDATATTGREFGSFGGFGGDSPSRRRFGLAKKVSSSAAASA